MPPTNKATSASDVVAPQPTKMGKHKLKKRHASGERTVENILKPLDLGDDDYRKVMDLMHAELVKGLTPATHEAADIKCYPTYVRSVPDGSENGDFLALDLGGTNFRVLLINLNGQEVKMESKIFIIPQHIMLGSGIQLFDHIADCIFKFMTDHKLTDRKLPLGFTFSFPCRQEGLDRAILTTWTKGFKCAGVEGNDIVQLLHEAIVRRGDMKNVKCLAVINDTVGALMSCAHSDRKCAIGLILGTGTNACYIENLDDVKTWDGDTDEPHEVLINSEWGAFGNGGALDFVLTDFDRSIDKHSINPGKQIYEKMISGMFLGEIARLAIERLRKNNLLFEGEGSYHLSTRGRFYTKYVSEIEGDDVDNFTVTKQIFEELELVTHNEQDYRLVRHVCSLVSRRAAYLASAGIACLLNKMQRKEVTIGVDGSLYRFHPFFHDLMMEKTRALTDAQISFKMMLSHDGSGKGAALVAAVANRLLEEKKEAKGQGPSSGH
ncbi:hexokinase-2 isoform X2 [Aplysia californica]|uniref:Phosphotransferase n=1 Tax=Aplysia californica TaxID=6500 RepID=A0ABM0JBP0_APLCA|nr:hexokinase-2 isoform X2 [Aplysia californica]XP_005089963.1 hexokinase-2 isoform X2 [Aplysia californica]XP_035826027.1 hexokinase-2 isoform X2 [Aplysia californica]XP_035826029.1 hexokinase-2 isoform X2 [Aplysia californica]